MTAEIIDGKLFAADIRANVKLEVEEFKSQHGFAPGLATVLVGDDPASETYVAMKHRMCKKLGIASFHHTLPATIDQKTLIGLIHDLNENPLVSGILVQLPLPEPLNEEVVLAEISIEKDVDGFHPVNIGRLAQQGRTLGAIPCTPNGIITLIKASVGDITGKKAVVVGRSNIVGMPVALLLIRENATVTICHSRTVDLPSETRQADILVVAVGQAEMVKADWIKPGAVVIDVGINRVDDTERERGYRLVGDVAYEEALSVAGAITPVPGGVGPMTIAMLMQNTLRLAQNAARK